MPGESEYAFIFSFRSFFKNSCKIQISIPKFWDVINMKNNGFVKEYVEKYRMHSDSRALFTTDKGRMNYAYLRSFIRKLGAKVGVKDLHAHMFRHFYASELYRLTGDIRLVQILVGHARIETTTIYEHITSEETVEKGKSAVEKLFRGGEDLNPEDQKYVGALAKRWEHWDLNPDLRVSSWFIVPVTHHEIS